MKNLRSNVFRRAATNVPGRPIWPPAFYFRVTVVIFSISVFWPHGARAAWEIRPIATAGLQYQTNPRMLRENEDEASGTLLGARLPMTFYSNQTEIFAEPRLVYSFYAEEDDADLEDEDKYLTGRIGHQSTRSSYGMSGRVSDVGIRTSEFESAIPDSPDGGTGRPSFANITQRRWYVNPYWNLRFTPLNIISVNAGYNDVRYSNTGLSSRFDYTNSYVSSAIEHVFDTQNKLSFSGTASQYDSIEPNSGIENDSRTTSLNTIYTYVISATLQASANLGWAKTKSTITRPPLFIDPDFGPICSLDFFDIIACEFKSDGSNFVGNLSLTKRTERIQYDVSIGQTVSPNSNGSEVLRRTFRGYLDSSFTERLSGRFGLIMFDQENVATVSRVDREYLRLDTNLRWSFSRKWAVRAAYQFTYNRNKFSDGTTDPSANNHRFFIGVVYSGDGWR